MSEYKLPKVWSAADSNQGKFSGINQPTAGARFEQKLPVGEQPFQLYSLGTPNGVKATILLEELLAAGAAEAAYDLYQISIMDGDQFGSDFVKLNPNSKIPALLDQSGAEPIRVFESAHILLYLAEKFGQFIPAGPAERAEVLNWLFWQAGAAPFLGGGFGHFFHYAPEKMEYPINRFTMEVKRQLDLLDKELAAKPYIAGQDYSIADIAIWSWYGQLAEGRLYAGSAEFLDTASYKHLQAWVDKITARPAVQRGLKAEYKAIK
ncbi:glutathione-dependent disulfide-bond oxidoreductase [Streptococcus panodentis]|uniref:Glutathione-dependent disulfide-bond oxidoreductase n=1 Tax=Streptococcus panodentis TaxID=1581472 RepID=A0ABS5AZF8_9STRE|nr:glutathione-dependent disulfide-bond oxidoreductase [Streptococcus panodentis]MBP2621967.1 glutathione-dependent disulfide-bond oxidoreductase [Streptococcus panodentis]